MNSTEYMYDGSVEQQNNYFAYGGLLNDATSATDVQTRKYNGKELDRMHGLDLYDYSARQYDAALGCFTSMDPLCEKYYHISPYAYCAGNPVKYVDPDGRIIRCRFDGTDYNYDIKRADFIDNKGNLYQGNDRFHSALKEALNELCKGSAGSQLVSDLAADEKIVKIQSGDTNEEHGRYGQEVISGVKIDYTQGSQVPGGTLYTTLGHELAHALDRFHGTIKDGEGEVWYSDEAHTISNAEKYATFIENKIRAEHGLALRKSYINNDNTHTRIIDSNNRSLFYDLNGKELSPNGLGYLFINQKVTP